MRIRYKERLGDISKALKILLIILLFSWVPDVGIAQDPVFFQQSDETLIQNNIRRALPMIFADINGDFRDDIVTSADTGLIKAYVQANDGQNYLLRRFELDIEGLPQSFNLADLNNNGQPEILISSINEPVHILELDSKQADIFNINDIDLAIYPQGCSMIDLDNDGWIDMVQTHDLGTNLTLMNDRNGQLMEEALIDFSTTLPSDNSGNYSSIWLDIDSDDDLDLYISKCKAGINDPNDPRRINQLFINDNGNFSEQAAAYKINFGDQTWCADSGDLDNDGDIDMVLINHEVPHKLLENLGTGDFIIHEDISNGSSINSPDLQVAIIDFNNDGWLDILIGGQDDRLLINKGDLEFTEIPNPFGNRSMATFAIGDINNDGYPDAYTGIPTLDDQLWINFGGANNYLKCSFAGIQSNRSGIGSKVEVFIDNLKYTRWVNSGTAYGITNSLNVTFGLAEKTAIDSIKVLWPSGHIDRYESLNANEHYVFTEASCVDPILKVDSPTFDLTCGNDTIVLNAHFLEEIIWNDNDSVMMKSVLNPGLYSFENKDTSCVNSSGLINISRTDLGNDLQLSTSGEIYLCENQSLPLSLNRSNNVYWQDGEIDSFRIIDSEGVYYARSGEACDDYTDSLKVNAIQFLSTFDVILYNPWLDAVEVNLSQDVDAWFADGAATELISNEPILEIDPEGKDTTIFFLPEFSNNIPVSEFGLKLDTLNSDFGNASENLVLNFEVHFPIQLKSIKIECGSEGRRRILLVNAKDTLADISNLFSKGVHELSLDIFLESGTYSLITDEAINMANLGQASPDLKQLAEWEVSDLPAAASISMQQQDVYPYFFEWIYQPVLEPCDIPLSRVQLIPDRSLNTSEIVNTNSLPLFPNPTDGVLNIDLDNQVLRIDVVDVNKRQCASFLNTKIVDTSALESGLYLIRVETSSEVLFSKFIKQ